MGSAVRYRKLQSQDDKPVVPASLHENAQVSWLYGGHLYPWHDEDYIHFQDRDGKLNQGFQDKLTKVVHDTGL